MSRSARTALAAGLALAAVTAGHAQALYKCGNTYTQTPCEYQGRPARINADAQPTAPAAPHGRELCRAAVTSAVPPIEPQRSAIDRVGAPVPDLLRIGDQVIEARRIDVFINAGTPQGAAAGLTPYRCYLSTDEKRLLRLVAPAETN